MASLKASNRALGLWFLEFVENKGSFYLLVVPGKLVDPSHPEEARRHGGSQPLSEEENANLCP